MRRCCAQLINSRCRFVNSTPGLTLKYSNGNIVYNSVRQFSVTPFALKNASSSSSRKPAERVGKNSKRNNNNSNKENNKAGMMFSHKTMEIEAIPIALQTSNDHKSSTSYVSSVDYDDKNKLASFVKETESTATLKELSNLTRKASQQRKRAVRSIPSLSASVIVESVSPPIRNSKVQRRKNNAKCKDDITETIKQKRSASRSREQKRQDKLINTLLLNTMVVEEKEVAASIPYLEEEEWTSAHIINTKERNYDNYNNSSNKRRRGRPCSPTDSTGHTKNCKKMNNDVNNESSELHERENDTPARDNFVVSEENNNHVSSIQRTRRAKSKAVRCVSESKQVAEVNHADTNKTEILPVEQKQQEYEQYHDTPSMSSMTCTADHDSHNISYVEENNNNTDSKTNSNIFKDKENKSPEEVNVTDHNCNVNVEHQSVIDAKVDNNVKSNKIITNTRKSNKVKTSKKEISQSSSSSSEEHRQSQRQYKEKQHEKKYSKKSKCKGKNEKQSQNNAKNGQRQTSQITVSESYNQAEEQERDVGNNARELNEDELIAQRASITKLFMVSDSVGFMFSAPPWDQQTILKELNEVDKVISSQPEVHNTNGNIVNSQYKKEDANDANNDNDIYDTSEYDSHLAYLANTPYFSQDKNYTSNSSNKRRTKDTTNTKSRKRNAPKPLSRKEAFMKVTDVFRRMLIEYGASHKIYIHVRDLQEQTPPVHLLPSSSSSSSSSLENQNTQMEGANITESFVEQTPMTSTKQNISHKQNEPTSIENTNNGNITASTNANVVVPTPVSVLTDLERFIKLQEWRKLAHAQAEKLKMECSVPAKYHTITRVRFADPTRMNWTIVLQSNAAKNVYEIIAELEEEERRKKLSVADAQSRRDKTLNLRNEQVELSHDQNDNNHMYQSEHWDDMLISSGTEAIEEKFEEELLEEEDEHMNDGTESNGHDNDANVDEQIRNNNVKNNNKVNNSAALDRRRVAFWCMQEFSKLAQNVLRNSKHGQNLHNQLKALQMLQQQQQQQQQHLLSTSANKVKLISCVNERNPFFLKPLLTVCATCVPRRESRLGQRVSEREFFTGKVDSSSIWLNGIKFGNFPIGTAQARRAKKKNDAACFDVDGDDDDDTGENDEKNKGKAHHHKRKNALVSFPLREMSEHELDNVVQRRGVPAMPRYSTRITMLIEHNELSPTDLISIAEERRGVARNERHYDNYVSTHDGNYNNNNNNSNNISYKNSAAVTSPFSLQEPVISECNTQRQVYEKVKAANKLNKPIRLFCLITDGSFEEQTCESETI